MAKSQGPDYEARKNEPWTDEEVESLRQLAAENTPTRVIGLKLQRTEDAIYKKAEEEGISLLPANQPSRS